MELYVKHKEVTPPPIEAVTLLLTAEEAQELRVVLCHGVSQMRTLKSTLAVRGHASLLFGDDLCTELVKKIGIS